jgi:hypothetical protein
MSEFGDGNFGSDTSASSGGTAVDSQVSSQPAGAAATEGDDAALANIFQQHKIDANLTPMQQANRAANPQQQGRSTAAPAGQQQNQAKGPEAPNAEDQQQVVAEPITPDDAFLLNRFQIRGDSLKAVELLPKGPREAFVRHLENTSVWFDQHVEHTKGVEAENAQLKAELAAVKKSGPDAPLTDLEKQDLADNTELFGEVVAKRMLAMQRRREAASQGAATAAAQPAEQQQPQEDHALRVMQQRDRQRGLKALEESAPATLKEQLKNPVVRSQIISKAAQLIRARIQPGMTRTQAMDVIAEYGEAEAIPDAAALLYREDYRKEAAAKLVEHSKTALRGTPDGNGRAGSTAIKKTKDQEETEAAEAALRRHNVPAYR